MLERIRRTASTPERLEAFILLIKLELGYQLHEAVQRTKFELSSATESEFVFQSGPVAIRKNGDARRLREVDCGGESRRWRTASTD